MPGHPHPARRAPLGGVALLLGLGTSTAVLATLTVLVRDAAPHAGAGAAAAALFALAVALGAWSAARSADDVARPARRAAWLLVVLAVVAALATRSVTWLYALLPGSGLATALACALPALVALGLVTGVLLALLACHGVRDLDRASRPGVTVLGGALAGLALAAPISSWLTSGLVGSWVELLPATPLLLAAVLAARAGRGPSADLAAPAGVPGRQGEGRGLAWPVMVASVLAGPLAVALDRLLEPAMDAGVHARDALLGSAAFAAVIGLAIGSVAARLRERPAGLTPWGLALAAAAALLVLVSDEHRAERLLAIAPGEGSALRVWWTALVAVGPPAALLAAALPPALKVRCDWTGRPGQATGRLVARVSAGFALGAVVGGVLVVPRLGAAPAVVAVAGLLLAVAVAMRLRTPGTWRTAEALLFLAGLGGLAWPGMWQELTDAAPRASTLWLVRDGGHAPLPVLPEPADVHLVADLLGLEEAEPRLAGRLERIEGLELSGRGRIVLADGLHVAGAGGQGADGSWRAGMHEFAAGLLGALLHPQPRCALVVGYGTGGAVRALAAAGCKRIAATDDEPAWLHYVAAGNTGELPPAVRTLAALSPRGALRGARDLGGGPCDVVIVAAAPLARGGHADVLTRPAYEELQGALAPGGVAVLCLDADDFDANDLESVAAAFAGTFPGGLAWAADDKLVLVGRRDVPCEIDGERWESMLAGGSLRDAAGRLRPGGLASGLVHLPAPAEAVDARSRPSVAPRAGRLGWEVASRRLRRSATGARAWLAALPPDVASLYRPGPVTGNTSKPQPGERWGHEIVSGWHQAGRDVSSPEVQDLLARQPQGRGSFDILQLLTSGRPAEALAQAEHWRATHPDSRAEDQIAAMAISVLPPSEANREKLRALHEVHDAGDQIQSVFADAMERQGAPAEAAEWLRAHLDVMPADSQQPGSRARLAALWMKAGPPTDERRAQAYAWLRADPVTYKSATHFRLLLETRPADATDGPDEAEGRRALASLQRKEARSNIERAQRTWSLGQLDEALDAARRAAETAPGYAPAFELFAFLAGCRDAADPAVAEALAHVPDRERARRIASWFGQTPAPLETETR